MSVPSSLEVSDLSLQYPIGKFVAPTSHRVETTRAAIAAISALPAELRIAVEGLSDSQLDTPYRPGGWTVRQVVHHVADSHINAYTRVRLALTEDWPTIRPYEEARWAELADARTLPVEVSLDILDSLHSRLAVLLESLTESNWQRGYVHPESGRQTLETVAQQYRWHGQHHTAHVTGLRRRMQW